MDDDPIDPLLERLRARSDCVVHPPRGQPTLHAGVALPRDLVRFYDLCGGALLFDQAELPLRLSGPDELVPAAPRLMTEDIAAELFAADPRSVVSTCFVIVDNGEGAATDEHVVIDLDPARLGRCYWTFWDRFGGEGDMPIVALTFGDLLHLLVASSGEGLEEALADWPTLGDAYD